MSVYASQHDLNKHMIKVNLATVLNWPQKVELVRGPDGRPQPEDGQGQIPTTVLQLHGVFIVPTLND